MLGTKIVTIFVGPENREFKIHKKLLSSQCAVFDRMFNGAFQEGVTQTATLPEDDVGAFGCFLTWLYQDKLKPEVFNDCETMISLFAFAEKYGIVRLMDHFMDTLVHRDKHGNAGPASSNALAIYASTHDHSRFRLYVSRMLAFTLDSLPDKDSARSKEIRDAFTKNADLMMDFLGHYRGMRGELLEDPREVPACDYHQHGKDEPCPYKEQ